jgi:hypothetical protein
MPGLIVLATGGLLCLTGLAVIVAPERFRALLGWFLRTGRYGIAVMGRLMLGLILLLGARETRIPEAAIALGLLFLAGALLVPLLGEERIGRVAAWWTGRSAAMLRAWGVVVIGLGAFVAWLAAPAA